MADTSIFVPGEASHYFTQGPRNEGAYTAIVLIKGDTKELGVSKQILDTGIIPIIRPGKIPIEGEDKATAGSKADLGSATRIAPNAPASPLSIVVTCFKLHAILFWNWNPMISTKTSQS